MKLSKEHVIAVNRLRRIVVQYDAGDPTTMYGMDMKTWLDYRFNYFDEPGSQVDSIWWDIGWGNYACYPSKILEPTQNPGLRKWLDNGIDWVKCVVDATHERGLEAFWHHRIAEVDIDHDGKIMENPFQLKVDHPDWVVKSWYWQGLWNLASAELREYKVSILRELAENYDFDGFQLDFSRHVPVLPVGHQWEMKEHATEFVRMVRGMLLEVAQKRGRPILLSAKVPENLLGCRMDGFDVAAWAEADLVDMFVLGSRTMDVDVAAFRKITEGKNIKLYPCFDDHHTTDGYRYPSIEFFRGIFGNWRQQGADGVTTFNWHCATREACEAVGGYAGPESHGQAYHEAGDPVMLNGRDKIFAVERRGGYPWSESYFNQNLFSPLPAFLDNGGDPTEITIRVCDDLPSEDSRLRDILLRVTLYGANRNDRLTTAINGVPLGNPIYDFDWKDPQILSPKPQETSGDRDFYPVDPDQKLLMLEFSVPAQICRQGENRVSIRIVSRGCHDLSGDGDCVIKVEKVEIHTKYMPGAQWNPELLADTHRKWVDSCALNIGGKGFVDTDLLFHRLPIRAKKTVRPDVWRESTRSSGLYVSFTTDSHNISARWSLQDDPAPFTVMNTLASSGLDLYARDDSGKWRWLALGASATRLPCVDLAANLPGGMRDYLLYLPLYNVVPSLEIGIDPDATIQPHQPFPSTKPIVYYGTSIVHGVGASRPGMTHAAILARRLNWPITSFGFSGSATMDLPVVDLMVELDSSLYIIDCLPNMGEPIISERTEPLVRRIRESRPDTPILLMEDRTYASAWILSDYKKHQETSRKAFREAYERLIADGVTGLHYLEGDILLGDDDDATVDTSHPTDLGYARYADAMEPVIRGILGV
jgi:hypothetical protein